MINKPVKGDLKTENGFDWVFDGDNWLKINPANEPVAWMAKLYSPDIGEWWDWSDREKEGYTPLYTHPVKEQLTDEEIVAEAEKQDWLGLTSKYKWQPEIDFARAILRKASEK